LAEQNAVKNYPVNAERIFIAGFSGGSHVALRLALAYPDIFRGAILNAGSDPVGSAEIPLPPKNLFLRFQEKSHLVLVTGERDRIHVAEQVASKRSMRAWCQFNVESFTPPLDHVVMDAAALSRALSTLLDAVAPDPGELSACRAGIEADMTAQLDKAEAAMSGDRQDACRSVENVDRKFGGLAASRTIDLFGKCPEKN
jgi:pimeloyl-ACP methyl ester carboxylesterase